MSFPNNDMKGKKTMKQNANRVLSILMSLVLLFSAVNFMTPSALADKEGTAGNMDADFGSAEILEMGEWRYTVQNGQAAVAGYTDTEATDVTVPYALGGFPVTGIGHKAFSGNIRLSRIQIHTNVTKIASDAFDGLNDVTVAAYNGAYALKYADEKNMNRQNISSAAVFADGAIDLSGLNSHAYRNLTDSSVEFIANEATFALEGQVLYFPAQGRFASGLARRIGSIQENGEYIIATLVPVAFEEVFVEFAAEDQLYLDWDHAILPEDVTFIEPESSNEATAEEYREGKLSGNLWKELGFKLDLGKGWTLDASGRIDVDASARVVVSTNILSLGLKNANVNITATTTLKGALKYKDSAKAEYSFYKSGEKLKYTRVVRVPFVTIAGMFNGYFDATFEFSFSGKLEFSYSSTTSYNYQYKDGKWSKNVDKGTPTGSVIAEAEIVIGPKFDISLDLGIAEIAEITILSLTVDLKLVATGSIGLKTISGAYDKAYCGDLNVDFKISFYVKVGIISLKSYALDWSYDTKKLYFKWPQDGKDTKTFNLYHAHYESIGGKFYEMKKVKECTLKNRKAEFSTSVYDEPTHIALTTQSNVNDAIKTITPPQRNGYSFSGWYVDTSVSGLKGGDYKVTSASKMPYVVANNGVLRIYAKWKDLRPVTSFALNKTSYTGLSNNGESVQLSVSNILPTNANNKKVKWSSSNTKVASVDSNGKVTLKNAGTATITATSVSGTNVKRTCTITVNQSVEKLNLNQNSISRYSDNLTPVQLTAEPLPANAFNKAVTWTSDNPAVAEVDDNGLVTLKAVGAAVITCTSVSNPKVFAKCTVNVYQAVTDIMLDKQSISCTNADLCSVPLKATVYPADAYNKALTWSSSNGSVAEVSGDGVVTLKAKGDAVITCASVSNPNIKATYTVHIIQAVTGITLNENAVYRYSDDKEGVQLTAAIAPDDAGDKRVLWTSSDPSVISVSETGMVTVHKAGTAVITCSSVSNPNVKASCSFTILQAVTGITLNKTAIACSSDEINVTYLRPDVQPADAYNKAVTWSSSNTDVATVTDDGTVAIIAAGDAVITCTSVSTPYITAVCTVSVEEAVTDMKLDRNTIYCYSSDISPVQLNVTMKTAQSADKTVIWESSDDSVATVSVSGIVNVTGAGTAIITCTSVSNPDVYAQCQVISRQSVTAVTLDKAELTWNTNDMSSVTIGAEVAPADAGNKTLLWTSSNPAVVTVSGDGTVVPRGAGTAEIVCRSESDPSVYVTVPVTVYQSVDTVLINRSSAVRSTADTSSFTLTAYVYPAYANNTGVVWSSSNKAVATVSKGKVTVKGSGTAVITCKSVSDPSCAAECVLTVLRAVDTITLNETEASVNVGDVLKLAADVQPNEAEDKDLVWTTSDPGIAAVDDEGNVVAVEAGIAVITCRSAGNNAVYAQCTVNVKQDVLSIVLNEDAFVCYGNENYTEQLIAHVQPANATDHTLSWSSSDTAVATVNDEGIVSVNGVGEALIICRSVSDPEVYAQCAVTAKQPLTAITLDKAQLEIDHDDEAGVQLNAVFTPDGTDDTDVIWETDNSSVAIVSDTGLVEGVSQGSTVIYCRSARNPDTVYAACAVTVKYGVEELYVEGETDALLPGETTQLTAKVYPDTADDTSVIWSSSDPDVAVVDEFGVVTACTYGEAEITATAADGSGCAAAYPIQVTHELYLTANVVNPTIYTQGTDDVQLAVVMPGSAAARRMSEAGNELVWTLENSNDDDAQLDVFDTTAEDCGETYQTTYAVLHGSTFAEAGAREYIVKCKAGDYSAEQTITINADDTRYAGSITLDATTFTVREGEEVLLPNTPVSGDGFPVSAGLTVTGVSGDTAFNDHASRMQTADGMTVSLDESGIYTAVAQYSDSNISYSVNVSFFVQDENGLVHIKAENIELDEEYITMLQGDTLKLNAHITPSDVYDASLTWTSTDDTVAVVDPDGNVTALRPGFAGIVCTANDGSGKTAVCGIAVESFLQLDETETSFTVYSGKDTHADLGIVNITYNSQTRLDEAGLNVTWSLEKVSGSASEIAVDEFRAEADEGVTVSGNRIRLLRINEPGMDEYMLTCRAGQFSVSCPVYVTVVDDPLPEAVELNQTEYTGTVNEVITLDLGYAGGLLPEDTVIDLDWGASFDHALSPDYDYFDRTHLIFSKAGVYKAEVIFSGANYRYVCPVTVTVADEAGNVPENITDLKISPDYRYLSVGETVQLSAEVTPEGIQHGTAKWFTSNTSVATVSQTGKLTAIGAGEAYIGVSVPEYDYDGGCYVVVEDGLTLEQDRLEHTVYVDGITRTPLSVVTLTAASGARLTEAPVWQLSRVNGNNLTLRVRDHNTTNADGDIIYGCEVILYSVSREGDTEYDLTCTAGGESVTIPVTVHATTRQNDLPSAVTLEQSVFTANINELITVSPQTICLPEGSALPDGIRVNLEGDALFDNALNAADYSVSRSIFTASFSRAGLYEANLIYTYSNMRYTVPVTFRIQDEQGKVPILSSSARLSQKALWLMEGNTEKLSVVFTPAEADEQAVTWYSSNDAVASVDTDGTVHANGIGTAEIVCVPADPYLAPMNCTVWVEDYLTVEIPETSVQLHRQGCQQNEVFSAILSEGTLRRLDRAGIEPVWKVTRVSGDHADIETVITGKGIIVNTTLLCSGGSDIYKVVCDAGKHTYTEYFIVEVLDDPAIAESIMAKQSIVTAAVGETVTVDMSPVCYPAGTVMPRSSDAWNLFAGLGEDYYKAMDYSVYEENGDQVTLRFNREGSYILTRQYFIGNMHYAMTCRINVGKAKDDPGLLCADTTDTTVYIGSGVMTAANVTLADSLMRDVFENGIRWTLKRVSGSSMKAALKNTENGVALQVTDVYGTGTDVWRVTCAYGNYSEYTDITVTAAEPRKPLPESVSLAADSVGGMMGDWLKLPVAAVCSPAGTALPESGDEFWNFTPNGTAADVCDWKIEDGILKVLLRAPGYYTGTLCYRSGSLKYSIPVYMTVTDEEGVIKDPAVEVHITDMSNTVYMGGLTGIVIGKADISRGAGEYYKGEALSLLKDKDTEWSVKILSGTAAGLSVNKKDNNSAEILLTSLKRTGTVTYEITCTVDGTAYTAGGTLTVKKAAAATMDPALSKGVYYARPGESFVLSAVLYDRGTSSALQSAVSWTPDTGLASQCEFDLNGNEMRMVFYDEGTYVSAMTAYISNIRYEIPFTVIVSDGGKQSRMVMRMPASLKEISESAFENCKADVVDLRGTQVTVIGSGAFKNCSDMSLIYIPSSVSNIAGDAFYGCMNVTIVCDEGSAADLFAAAHGIPVCYE